MLKQLNRLWRLIGTALSFLLFGLGGVIIPLIAVPILRLWPGSTRQRQRRARLLIHHVFKGFTYLMRGLGVLSWQIQGIEKLQRPNLLVIANHPTLIDVVFLVSLIPHADCVVKGALLKNPAMRGFIRLTGFIPNDRGESMIDAARQSMRDGSALIIFPEGTRTTPGESIQLQRGCANIAVRCAHNLTPVIINCQPPTLSKQHKWYHVPPEKVLFQIRVEDDIDISPYLQVAPSSAARQLTRDLTDYFNRKCTQSAAAINRKP